jgi:hypothetical protein
VSEPLEIVVSTLAAGQIRAAEEWWRINRPKAPNAIPEDLDRASSLIAIQPELGARTECGFAWRAPPAPCQNPL